MMAAVPILPDLNLQPGELYFTRRPAILRTILGSCVGVTFWSARLGAGALCHCVLPRCPQQHGLQRFDPNEGPRYVDFSIRYLARKFDQLGAGRQEIEVKAFGGADVLTVTGDRSGKLTVGAMNCLAAEEVLDEEGFAVVASDLGGVRGRRIHFNTLTGQVLLYRLASQNGSKR